MALFEGDTETLPGGRQVVNRGLKRKYAGPTGSPSKVSLEKDHKRAEDAAKAADKLQVDAASPGHGAPTGAQNNLLFHQWKGSTEEEE